MTPVARGMCAHSPIEKAAAATARSNQARTGPVMLEGNGHVATRNAERRSGGGAVVRVHTAQETDDTHALLPHATRFARTRCKVTTLRRTPNQQRSC